MPRRKTPSGFLRRGRVASENLLREGHRSVDVVLKEVLFPWIIFAKVTVRLIVICVTSDVAIVERQLKSLYHPICMGSS